MANESPEEFEEVRKVVIPYTPRRHFLPIHRSNKRFKFVCMHRRAGKSVGSINEMLKRAIENTRQFPPPRYGYVGPSFAQTKDLIWGYLKTFAGVIPGVKFSEGDLCCTLPNGATITLYGGAAAWERMRGLYFDGIMLDEFPLLNPAVFSTVVRPCLADYRGWAIVSGTSNGDDHFNELLKRIKNDDSWDVFIVPVTDTDALHPDEVIEMTKDMSPEEYAREMLCSFDAPIEGAYYAEKMNDLKLKGHICKVPHQPEIPVITWWDLGIDDETAIWFVQIAGKEIHVIDFISDSGKSLEYYAKLLLERKGYVYRGHVLPHDVMAREMSTAKTRYEFLSNLLDNIIVCPMHAVEDGISSVRGTLSACWFDEEKTAEGLSALKNYHKSKTGKPVHNWASHPSDAFRIGCASLSMVSGYVGSSNVVNINSGAGLRRRRRGRV